jgi:glutathione reductase (NADPH)
VIFTAFLTATIILALFTLLPIWRYEAWWVKYAAHKILTDANNLVLGTHILTDQASGVINTIKQAMLNETTVGELYQQTIVCPYPTRESDLSYILKPLLCD